MSMSSFPIRADFPQPKTRAFQRVRPFVEFGQMQEKAQLTVTARTD
jgi:hypothetical protein